MEGIGSEHHTDGTVVDNAHIVATLDETILDLYLEIIDGTPAVTKVFGYILQLESCSAYHGICNLKTYTENGLINRGSNL